MKRIIQISIFIVISVCGNSQSWTYSKGGDAFDGEYRTCSAIGKSDDGTYSRPLFVANNFDNSSQFNVYVGNVGYFCDNVKIKFVFDNSDIIYYGTTDASNKQEIVFLRGFHYNDIDNENFRIELNKFQFLELVKSHNKMYVRLEDDCDVTNIEFSLSGSSKAINYVYGNQADEIAKELKGIKAKEIYDSGPALLKLSKGGKYIILWDSPGVKGEIIAKLLKADTVDVLARDIDYFLIETKDTVIGWCHKNFITPIVF